MNVVLIQFASFFCYWGALTPSTFITSYAISYGIDDNLAFYLISMINAGSTFGRILPGLLADIVGAFNVQTSLAIIMSISILAYWTPSINESGIITFAFFYGFFSGGFLSLVLVCCAMISPVERIGARYNPLNY